MSSLWGSVRKRSPHTFYIFAELKIIYGYSENILRLYSYTSSCTNDCRAICIIPYTTVCEDGYTACQIHGSQQNLASDS